MKPTTQTSKKTSIGGQALIEGVMMRGPFLCAMAVRGPDRQIDLETWENPPARWYKRVPLLRGIFNFIEMLTLGYRCLMKSAEKSGMAEEEEEPGRLERWMQRRFGSEKAFQVLSAFSMVLGIAIALAIFLVLPAFLSTRLRPWVPYDIVLSALEGVFKILLFVGYLALVSRMPEMRRVFQYHGAEHKTIFCYENGLELTVENVRRQIRFHPRCGTSFLLIVMVVSVIVFSMVTWNSVVLRVLLKLVTLPVVVGISYEIIKWAGRSDSALAWIISRPGLWLQRLTTAEPEDDMIEVAIASMKPVIPSGGEDLL